MKFKSMQFKFLITVISATLAITVFLVILQNRDLEDLEGLLKKFDEECLNESIATDKENISVSIAKGFARYDSKKDSNFIDVFNRADDAMYENKREMKGAK